MENLRMRDPRRVPAIWCFCDVQSGWEGSRRSHDGEVALWNLVGITFPHRRTRCGAKGRRPRDQIKGREGDAGTDDEE